MGIEEELARRATTDIAAFGEFYQSHVESVYDFATAVSGSHAAAQTMTESVFDRVVEQFKAGNYSEKQPLREWLYTHAATASVPQLDEEPDIQSLYTPFDRETRKILWLVTKGRFTMAQVAAMLNTDIEQVLASFAAAAKIYAQDMAQPRLDSS